MDIGLYFQLLRKQSGGSQIQVQPGQHNETLPHNKKPKKDLEWSTLSSIPSICAVFLSLHTDPQISKYWFVCFR